MLGRRKSVDNNGVVNEVFDIAGSGGSMYSTTIGCMFKCDCPDYVSVSILQIWFRAIDSHQGSFGRPAAKTDMS